MATYVPLASTTNVNRVKSRDRSPVGAGAVIGPSPDGSGPAAPTDLEHLGGADDLRAIEALTGLGFAKRIGANAWVLANPEPSDGDKGDITVTGAGLVWVIDPLAVTDAKINSLTWAKITARPTTLLGYGITDAQPLDADLSAIAGLATLAFGRSLLTAVDAPAGRALLGAGTSSFSGVYSALTGIPATFPPSAHSHTFASLTGIPTTLAGYGIADAQPLDSDLTAIAGLATLAFGRSLLTAVDAAAVRALIGAGSSSFSGAFSALSGIPTTRAGYGITDAAANGLATGSGLTMNTARILGRTTALTGAIEELTAGTSLALSSGSLNTVQNIRTTDTPTFAGLTLTGTETIDFGAGALPTALTGVNNVFRLSGADTLAPTIEPIGFGAIGLSIRARSIGNTRASPAATPADQAFFNLASFGYDTAYVTSASSNFQVRADGPWSATNHGTYFYWGGCPAGSAAGAGEWMRLASGNLGIGAVPTGARLNVAGSINFGPADGSMVAVGTTTTFTPSGGSPTAHYGMTFGAAITNSLSLSGYNGVFLYTTGGIERLRLDTAGATIGGAIQTGNPSGGTAAAWKLGTRTAGAVATGGKVRVEIAGVAVDLLTA